ncbi:MAG TPA: bifunctional glutamate N-acetyltransferase/amino-acid acetyltransferase ArgJ [Gammaproteobacteria bacterium]|nr:bifunctional glutamate N-acetyltransferase/amino-acid acetyltransferase ArgJ [Gammaproteobacteria bacterium]
MAVGLDSDVHILPVPGVRLAVAEAGVRYQGRDDLALIELAEGATVAGVFTRNRFCAAPVTVAKTHLAVASPRCLLINAGNANAGTGDQGMENALRSCLATADALAVSADRVLPFSTGVIGEQLPVEKIEAALPALVGALSTDAWPSAARAIMTTDTVPKGISKQVEIDGRVVTISGIAKGSGMIHPDMATLLAFIATDAVLPGPRLRELLTRAVAHSFNSITVDGDTSTNDACILMATGASGVDASEHAGFREALGEVFDFLAQAIIRDAEGATRFVTIEVKGAASDEDANTVAYTVATSPLVKTALFAGDPNWGRILAAIGRARVDKLAVEKVDIHLGEVAVIRQGQPASGYTEAAGAAEMEKPEVLIAIDLHQGDSAATVWTSDLSYDYVKINAEYRS